MLFLETVSEQGATGGTGSLILMLVVMLAAFYFIIIRPENKKKKQAEDMRNSLKVGDNITTIGGMIGDIVHIDDENLVIEVGADRVRVEFSKWAVSTNNTAVKEAEKQRLAAAAAKKDKKVTKKK